LIVDRELERFVGSLWVPWRGTAVLIGRFTATPDYADLHRHLGGAVHPKILYGYLREHAADIGLTSRERDAIAALLSRFPDYDSLRGYFTARHPTLEEFLQLHSLVEPLQMPGTMHYFLYRIARGARFFEHTSLLELRFCPYLRTDPTLAEEARLAQMELVIEAVAEAARQPEFAVDIRLLLCLHSGLPDHVNEAILRLALRRRDLVRGLDIAGPEEVVGARIEHFVECLRRAIEQLNVVAKKAGVRVHDPAGLMDPVARAKGAVAEATSLGFDAVIVDTAGRLHIDDELMTELVAIKDTTEPSMSQ
jgi:adenosine deaminase